MLLELLDLDLPGLEKVKAASGDPAKAAAELLAYYRARTSVKHPVDRAALAKLRGKPLDKNTLAIADDALRNVLITTPHYPRFDFGKNISWLTNQAPNGDKEWLWQLNRHNSWGPLGTAWRHTGNNKYAECYVRQLTDWIARCPRDKTSPAWRTIEAGIRGYLWTAHFQHFVDAPAYTPDVLVRHLNSFYEHAELLTGRAMSTSNWGLMEAEGAAFIAMTFPEFRNSKTWREKSFTHLNAMMKAQVRSDGHQYEQCLGYHLGCIDWFARTGQMAAANGLEKEFPQEYWKRLELMCDVPMKLGLPGGSHTQFGDDHSDFHWRRRLASYAAMFKRDDLLFAATAGKQGKAPAETAFALPESGFYSMRSGWDEAATMLVLKCGLDGGWHSQPDNNTFEICSGGRRLMPDSGTYIYSGNEQATRDRAWFRQTRVHQTMTLDGKDTSCEPKLVLWKPGAELDTLVVENRGSQDFVHRRAVLFVRKKYFVVVDEALGKFEGRPLLHFQLAPGEAVIDGKAFSARTGFATSRNLLLAAMAQPGLALEKEDGQVSFEYGKKETRPALRFELAKGNGQCRFITVLVPYEGEAPRVEVALVGQPTIGASAIELDVAVNGDKTRIGYNCEGSK